MKKRIYIFGAHSRAQTLAVYLQYLYPGLVIEAFLYDNNEQNPAYVGKIPVIRCNQHISPHTDYPVYIGTRGIFHSQVRERLQEIGFQKVYPVTVELDGSLRNRYLEKYFAAGGKKFLKIDRMTSGKPNCRKEDVKISAKIYVIRSVSDRHLHNDYRLASYETEIQAGAALTDRRLASGILTDDTGDNISDRNMQFCELTALYWMWKHGSEEIVGLAHYRRHFVLPEDWILRMRENQIDVILPVPLYAAPSLEENFKKRHSVQAWEEMMDCLYRRDVQECQEAKIFFQGNLYSPCNMFIMSRETLDDLCGWLFPVLFRTADRVGRIEDGYQNRYPGFLSERLISFFFERNREKYRIVYADKNFLE